MLTAPKLFTAQETACKAPARMMYRRTTRRSPTRRLMKGRQTLPTARPEELHCKRKFRVRFMRSPTKIEARGNPGGSPCISVANNLHIRDNPPSTIIYKDNGQLYQSINVNRNRHAYIDSSALKKIQYHINIQNNNNNERSPYPT